jgi:uncharacterized OsmC-like protein
MNAEQLRALQAPLKDSYRNDAAAAAVTLSSSGELDAEDVACRVDTGKALVDAGLHPATGGTGALACSGNMLLDALVACAGVTLKAVATAIEFRLQGGRIRAEGDLDFRGTLGLSKDAPVGFSEIRLVFELETDEPADRIDQLTRLTERFCVVFQTLAQPPLLTLEVAASGSD